MGDILLLIEAFQTSRAVQVKILGLLSWSVNDSIGWLQGSVLDSFLFLIYVNHAVSKLNSKLTIFVDDIETSFSFDDPKSTSTQTPQNSIDILVSTSLSKVRKTNPSKYVVIRFSLKTIPFHSQETLHTL